MELPASEQSLVSLPLRERGLKLVGIVSDRGVQRSLPLRERGLKFASEDEAVRAGPSLPLRERGLKCLVTVAGDVEPRRSLHGSVD